MNRTWHEAMPHVLITEQDVHAIIHEAAQAYFQEHTLSDLTVRELLFCSDLQEDKLRAIVQERLSAHEADGLGRADYALGTAGGAVLGVEVLVPILPETEVVLSNDPVRIGMRCYCESDC